MAATAPITAPAPVSAPASGADVAEVLLDADMPLADLIARTSQAAVASAWARGDIELGHAKYVVTGNPRIKLTREGESPSGVIVEGGVEWSGPKTARHKSLADTLAGGTLPTADRYRKYVTARNDQGEEFMKPVVIPREEAVALCALRVRLTDKGLGALAPAA